MTRIKTDGKFLFIVHPFANACKMLEFVPDMISLTRRMLNGSDAFELGTRINFIQRLRHPRNANILAHAHV